MWYDGSSQNTCGSVLTSEAIIVTMAFWLFEHDDVCNPNPNVLAVLPVCLGQRALEWNQDLSDRTVPFSHKVL